MITVILTSANNVLTLDVLRVLHFPAFEFLHAVILPAAWPVYA
jgi:hypothetical protein